MSERLLFNQELLKSKKSVTDEKYGKSTSKTNFLETYDNAGQNEIDTTLGSESVTEEETENMKKINQYFVNDFQELQK